MYLIFLQINQISKDQQMEMLGINCCNVALMIFGGLRSIKLRGDPLCSILSLTLVATTGRALLFFSALRTLQT